jgi:hypothetical protein
MVGLIGLAGLSSLGCVGEIGAGSGAKDPLNQPPMNGNGGTTGVIPMPPNKCVSTGGPSVGVAPLRRLTRTQYNNTVRDLLGLDTNPGTDFSIDEKVGPFFSNATAPISDLQAEQYLNAAESLADQAVTSKLTTLLPCDPATTDPAACGAKFVDTFGLRAYRRPLLAAERTTMVTLFESGRTDDSFNEGVRRVIQATLQSPQFLYRFELGAQPAGSKEIITLDQYILAERMSYYLWDSMPDAELFRAAGAGELSSPATLRTQATRLIGDARAAATIASFHRQWLGLDQLPSLEKDATAYPTYTPALRDAMDAETAHFTDYVIRAGDGRLETLLTAPFSFVSGPLATLYGVKAGSDPTKPTNLDATQRGGLLTQPSVLAVMSHADQSAPIRRGKLVREQFFCQTLSPPPPGVDLTPPMPVPGVSTRERFQKHRTEAVCAACHGLIDPLGFGFENYDGVGAYRAMDGGKAVDASGEVTGTDVDGTFNGVLELSKKLASSPTVRDCVAQKWFNFGFGRTAGPDDACSLAAVSQAFNKSNNIRDLLVELVATDAFRYGRFEKGAP